MADLRFRDDAGWQWEVIEHPGGAGWRDREVPLAGQRCLYFLSRYETRRCDEFPEDWARRSAAELARLCEVAKAL